MNAQSKALYLPTGDGPGALVYYRDGGLEARTFDPDRNVLGDPRTVTASVDYNSAGIGASFQAAADGRVIIVRPAGNSGMQLTWFDRNGEQSGTLGPPTIDLYQPRLSPKGDRIAFTRPDPKNGNRDVWIIEVDRGIAAPLAQCGQRLAPGMVFRRDEAVVQLGSRGEDRRSSLRQERIGRELGGDAVARPAKLTDRLVAGWTLGGGGRDGD
jgi:hypothetical protein